VTLAEGLWPRERRARAIAAACLTVGALYLAKAIYRGLSFDRGDFYYSLPGAYAQHLNPTLWNSPDLRTALDFNHGAYLYGPTQYLTLFPIVFLDSYRSIALVLLGLYVGALLLAWHLLWKLLVSGEPEMPGSAAMLFAIVFAFLPLTQVLIQREFEAIAWLALVAACTAFVRRRDAASGAAVAFLTWFKYWPIVFVAAFVMQRRLKAIGVFVIASLALLGSAHALFGLPNFLIGRTAGIVTGLVRPLGSGEVLYPAIPRGAQKSDFCRQWIWGRGTVADVRWALCGVEDRFPALPARPIFFAILAVTAIVFVWGALRLEMRPALSGVEGPVEAKWGAIWEFSLLAIAGGAFVHAHYYYFIVFLLPLSALAFWYLLRPQPWRRAKMALLATSYLLLNAFMIPTSWLSVVLERDAWALFLDSGLCLLGLLLLLGLVLWELVQCSMPRVVRSAAPATTT